MLSGVTLVSINYKAAVSVSASSQESITVHFIDVGQGDSIFIDTPVMDVLVDGGKRGAGDIVMDYLESLGVTRIHLMVATHMDADHIGGLITVLSSTFQVDEVLINNQTGTSRTYNDFMSLANTHSLQAAQRGDTYTLTQNVNLTVLNPVQPLELTSQNENSIVMRLQIGQSSFLLMGDAEADTEKDILKSGLEVNSDVLKVGHHGSRSSTTDAFLSVVSPSIAVICAGEDNQYGHPHPETLDKLLEHGIVVYATYKSGSIVATVNSTSINFLYELQPIPEFPSSLVITSLMVPTLISAIIYRRKKQA
jgi:competence protein ComEC